MSAANGRRENPYIGPDTFRAGDEDLFFGREREAKALLSYIIVEPLVLFTAQSGAGKSSLINVRLKPGLEALGFEVYTARLGGRTISTHDQIDNIYVYNLLTGLEEQKKADAARLPLESLGQQSLSQYLTTNFLSGYAFTAQGRPPRLLVIDQFEEIVTTYPAYWRHRAPFFRQLNQIMRADPLLWVLLTMREDHVASLDPYLYLLTDRLRARFYMERLDPAAATEAIEKPALGQGRAFAPEATRLLLNSLRQIPAAGGTVTKGNFIEPLQLQVVCYELWQKLKEQPGEHITPEDLRHTFADLDSAVEEALARFYNNALRRVAQESGVEEFDIRYWFDRHLITGFQTRGAVYQGETKTADLPNEVVNQLNARFLLHSETHAGNVWYELIHDRFVLPVIEANNRWYMQPENGLLAALREWDRQGRQDADKLLTQTQLDGLTAKQKESLSPLVQQFLQASRAQAQEQMVITARQAHAQKTRVVGWFIWVLAVFMIGLIGALLFANSQRYEAQDSESTAVAIKNTAVAQENRALTAFNEANAQAEAAATSRAGAVAAQSTAEAASLIIISEAEAAGTASALSVMARETAVAASNIAATREAEAVLARDAAATQEALAEAASDLANTEAELAQIAFQEAETQREQVLAQSLAINALNAIRRNNDTELAILLALEANKLNQAQTADEAVQEIINQTFLNIVAQPYLNITFQEKHESQVAVMTFTPDGQTLISIDVDGNIRLWHLNQPVLASTLLPSTLESVDFVGLTPDGGTAVLANRDGLIQIWRLDGPNPTTVEFQESAGPLLALAVAPNGLEVAVVVDSLNARIRLWPLQENGEPVDSVGITTGVARTIDYTLLTYASDGSAIYAQDPATTIPSIIRIDRTTLTFEDYTYFPLAFAPDGGLAAYYNNPIVTGAGDFRIAHSNTPFNLFHVPEALTLATPAAFNYSNTLFADTADNVIRLWRLHKAGGHDTASFLAELKGNDDLLTAMAFAPDGRLAAADASGTIRLWYPNLASTAVANQATQIAFSPTNDQVAWLENGQLYMQAFDDFTAGITVTTVYTGYDVRLNSLAFSPDGSRIAAGGGPVTGRGVVYIWQTADPNNPVIVLEGHTQPVQSIAFSPDGAVLASGSGLGEYNSGDDTVLIWDLENPAIPSHRLTAHIRMITKLLFAPDGKLLASASADGTVRLWSTNDYSEVGEPLSVAANERVLSLAFSNDSSQIVAGSDNITARPVAASGRIYLWALNDLGASPRILLAQNSYGVNDLAFSPDGSLLVSATADGLVRLWQFEGALPTSLVLVGYGRGVKSVAFARDGRLVSADGQIVQLHSTPAQLLAGGCTLVQRNLSWSEWQRYIGKPAYVPTCPELPNHSTAPAQP